MSARQLVRSLSSSQLPTTRPGTQLTRPSSVTPDAPRANPNAYLTLGRIAQISAVARKKDTPQFVAKCTMLATQSLGQFKKECKKADIAQNLLAEQNIDCNAMLEPFVKLIVKLSEDMELELQTPEPIRNNLIRSLKKLHHSPFILSLLSSDNQSIINEKYDRLQPSSDEGAESHGSSQACTPEPDDDGDTFDGYYAANPPMATPISEAALSNAALSFYPSSRARSKHHEPIPELGEG